MSIESIVKQRAGQKCELCSSTEELNVYSVPASPDATAASNMLLCEKCRSEIEDAETLDQNHWRCLNDSMWSQEPVVQVMAYRMLSRLSSETWAQDLLDMLYLEDDKVEWAQKGLLSDEDKPRDVNGVELKKGDDVTIIKDLPVKGSSMIIKQGTAVRGINLTDDPKHVQGKVNGQTMFIIAEYCRKK